jgi:3-deoxy-D-manno-octulosonate 8-phosphate phosphatase (KDO 8-P phosphatase)
MTSRTSRSSDQTTSPDLTIRARCIGLLLLDVDGVLTDGRLHYGPGGEALKVFDVRDGHGLVMLRDHIELGVLSGRPAGPAENRLRDLRFQHIVFSQQDKLSAYQELVRSLRLTDEQVAYMGDDVNDLAVLGRVGLAACPADACPEVRASVHLVTKAPGGRGAVRELCELILRAKGLWKY